MIIDPAASTGSAASVVSAVTGKVLAVSTDGSRLAVSDPAPLIGGPGRVFIYNQSTGATPVTLPIPNATAAAFSPDGLKTFIVSGASLYLYSTVDALKGPISLSPITNGNGVTFSQYGAFALISGAPHNVEPAVTCRGAVLDGVPTPGLPLSLQPIPDAVHLIALDPPSIDILAQKDVAIGECTATVNLDVESVTNLGQGNFTPIAMLVSSDGAKAYVVAQGLSSILVFDVVGKTTSAIPLTDDAVPLGASLSTDGRSLFVTTECKTKDTTTNKCTSPTLHVIDTIVSNDVKQITFSNNFCTNVDNLTLFCTPDLVAVKP
jgi:DNA-binding beta-propeller fold protein YncE